MPRPTQVRYAAPAHLSVAKTALDVAIAAATPVHESAK
jgi:hypothetical protein